MKFRQFGKALLAHIRLGALGVLIGVLGGLVGAAFAHCLSLATGIREGAPYLILLLPVGGIATVLLYRAFALSDHGGTTEIVDDLKQNRRTRTMAAPLIFVSTAITHLFGGSAGREGAAIQLGGAGAAAVSDALHLKGHERTVLILSGMSAVFAGVFGTPLTAAVFILEFKINRKIFWLSILPCLVSSLIASEVASLLGVVGETLPLDLTISLSLSSLGKICLLALALSAVGFVLCFLFNKAPIWAKKRIARPIPRIVVISFVLIAMTVCVGDMRYNNAGMEMALAAVEGSADYLDFALKILFTTVTLSAGFKGGKIVPTFCIGATFGCVFGALLGLDAGLSAALGLVGLFCCVTHSPVSAVFLGIEMFGLAALPYFILISILLWLLSVKNGLFESRFFLSPIFSRLKKPSTDEMG